MKKVIDYFEKWIIARQYIKVLERDLNHFIEENRKLKDKEKKVSKENKRLVETNKELAGKVALLTLQLSEN